jgi:hypothetical protein
MQEATYTRHRQNSWEAIDSSMLASFQVSSPCYTTDLLHAFNTLDCTRFGSIYAHEQLDADRWFDISRRMSTFAPDCVVHTIDDSFTNYNQLLGILVGILQEFDAWYDASYTGDEADIQLLDSIINIHDTILGNDQTGLYHEMDQDDHDQDDLEDSYRAMCTMIGS